MQLIDVHLSGIKGKCNKVQFEFSQLKQKIKLLDPQFLVASVLVSKASKVLSISSVPSTLEDEKQIMAEFVDSVLGGPMPLLLGCSCITFTLPVQDQMVKLHEGVRFASILLTVNTHNI